MLQMSYPSNLQTNVNSISRGDFMKSNHCCPNCGSDISLSKGAWRCETNDIYTCWEGPEPSTRFDFLMAQRKKAIGERDNALLKLSELEKQINEEAAGGLEAVSVLSPHEASVAELLRLYPYARKATRNNVELGDIICNHANIPCIIVTEEMIARGHLDVDFFYIVGKTHLRSAPGC